MGTFGGGGGGHWTAHARGRQSIVGADMDISGWGVLVHTWFVQTLWHQGGTGTDSYIYLADWTRSVAAIEEKKNLICGYICWREADSSLLELTVTFLAGGYSFTPDLWLHMLTGGRQSIIRAQWDDPGCAGSGWRSGHAATPGWAGASRDLWTRDHRSHHAQGQDPRPVPGQQAPGLPLDRVDCGE